MATKKDLTPKQLSNSLSYVQKEAPFLARMKNNTKEKQRQAQKFQNYEDGQDDDDYDELQGAQVVELDDKGKEIHKDEGEKSDEEEAKEEEEEQPAVDENGRILFRSKRTTSKNTPASTNANTKRKLKSIIDQELNKNSEKKKKSKKSKASAVKLNLEYDD